LKREDGVIKLRGGKERRGTPLPSDELTEGGRKRETIGFSIADIRKKKKGLKNREKESLSGRAHERFFKRGEEC